MTSTPDTQSKPQNEIMKLLADNGSASILPPGIVKVN